MKKKIFITDYINNPSIEKKILGKFANVVCLKEKNYKNFPKQIYDADGLLVWHSQINNETIKKLKKNCVIIRYGVGYENIDLKSCKENKIIFANTPDYGVDEVADTSCAMILNFLRKINFYNEKIKKSFGKWQAEVINLNKKNPTKRTSDHSLGIIGLGRIGSSVALKMKNFKIKIGFFDPNISSGYEKTLDLIRYDSIDELISNSSIISINATLNENTMHMVDKKFISKLNKNTILINTARGAIIENLDILLAGLKKNKISYLGLDVTPEEPPKNSEKLIKVWRNKQNLLSQRIIINPHAGYFSSTSINEMRIKASENMLRHLTGKPLKNIISL